MIILFGKLCHGFIDCGVSGGKDCKLPACDGFLTGFEFVAKFFVAYLSETSSIGLRKQIFLLLFHGANECGFLLL